MLKSIYYFLVAALVMGAAQGLYAEDKNAQEQVRVVSVSGGVTEIIYELGAGNTLVGVDTTSEYPEAAKELPQVGYMRALSVEGIASLKPDYVFLTKDAGPPHVKDKLKMLNIHVVELNSESSVEGLLDRINTLATLLDKKKEGEALKSEIQKQYKTLQSTLAKSAKQNKNTEDKKVLFILSHGGNSLSIAGAGTAADSVLKLAGLTNVAADFQGYRMLGKEGLLKLDPDVIITTQQGLDAWGGAENLIKQNGLAFTSAAKNEKVIALDAMYLLGFGPRIVLAAQELHQSVSLINTVNER